MNSADIFWNKTFFFEIDLEIKSIKNGKYIYIFISSSWTRYRRIDTNETSRKIHPFLSFAYIKFKSLNCTYILLISVVLWMISCRNLKRFNEDFLFYKMKLKSFDKFKKYLKSAIYLSELFLRQQFL